MCKTNLFKADRHAARAVSFTVPSRGQLLPSAHSIQRGLRYHFKSCVCTRSQCSCWWCLEELTRGVPAVNTPFSARTDATPRCAARRSAAGARFWMTAGAVRSVLRDGESTATAPCPGCTASSADRDSSVTSTRMRMIMEMNMASVKVQSCCVHLFRLMGLWGIHLFKVFNDFVIS